jgi:hypothetical protein
MFTRSAAQNAGSLALLAASPQVAGITGEHWVGCQIARGNPLLVDEKLGKRLWEISEQIVSRIAGTNAIRGMSPEVRINRGRFPAQFMKS